MKFCPAITRKISDIIWASDLVSVRFSIAFASFFWALLLIWPGELFTPERTTYRLMAQIANENLWALGFFIHGLFASITLICEKRNKFLFFGDALWGSVMWTAATIACFASHWQLGKVYAPPAAMSAELALMLGAWWWTIRWIVKKETERKNGKRSNS